MLLHLAACFGPPSEIPNEQGVFTDSEDLRRLSLVALPDNLLELYLLPSFVETRGDACPALVDVSEGRQELVGGCTDAEGAHWLGSATWIRTGETELVDLDDFGVDQTDMWTEADDRWNTVTPAKWTLKGEISSGDSSAVDAVRIDALVDWEEGDESFFGWANVTFTWGVTSGGTGLGSLDGKVGISDWGTARIDGAANPNRRGRYPCECDGPVVATGGEIQLNGVNAVTWNFRDCGCPTWALDGEDQGESCEISFLQAPVLSTEPADIPDACL